MGPENQGGDVESGYRDDDWDQNGHGSGPQASTPSGSDMQVQSDTSSVGDGYFARQSVPVWLTESSKTFHWRWVPVRVRQAVRAVIKWSNGPDPPQIQKITPFFPSIQEFLPKVIDTYLPKKRHKAALLAFFYFCWLLTFSLVLAHSTKAGNIEGYGKPQSIWCGASFWEKNNGCGLNGNDCRPFDNTTFAFRCPANCKEVMVLNPYAVGNQEINYRQLVIGGPTESEENSTIPEAVYRGDSFICQAAIHSGLVGNDNGGCGVAMLAGEQSQFTSTKRHGIESIGFDSSFPKSFTFVSELSSDCVKDLRWPLFAVTCGFTTILSFCTLSPLVFFSSVFTMLFFHVGLVSDPPGHAGFDSLFSTIVGRFLPAAFVAFVFYRFCVEPQQTGLTATVERTVLWLGGAWVGSLNNYTFYYIPLQRLTPHDLQTQPGAKIALILVVLLIFSIALSQAWFLRQEGLFRRYLAIYAILVGAILLGVAEPWLNLRIHHYFLAILLISGTRTQTRPSLLWQGILIGLFINGVARWGFDSILQTTSDLRGDGQLGSLLPNITAPIIGATNITFLWDKPPVPYDGLSVLVNDVERHRWYYGEGAPSHTFNSYDDMEKEYFRFGYMYGSSTGDFTRAGVWEINGTWVPMLEGPS